MEKIHHVSREAYQVRFNGQATTAAFNIDGVTDLPYNNKSPLKGVILGVKGLQGALFTKHGEEPKTRSWVEVYYLDNKNRFCATLFHDQSAESFIKAFKAASFNEPQMLEGFYTAAFTVTTVSKTSKSTNATYKVAEFEFEYNENWKELKKYAEKQELKMFRNETLSARLVFATENCLHPDIEGTLNTGGDEN